MSRDSAGVYSLPPGYLAQTGQTILASQHNPPLEDIASALTGSLPRNGSAAMLGNLNMGGNRINGLADGAASTDAATKGQLDALIPPGTIWDYAGASAPAGWLICAGQAVSRSAYAALFSAIGGQFGGGDGFSTFNVPDCRGRVSAGKDDMGGADAGRLSSVYGAIARVRAGTLGTASHTLSVSQMPNHFHAGVTNNAGLHGHTFSLPISGNVAAGAANIQGPQSGTRAYATENAGVHSHDFATDFRGDSQPHPNAQPTLILLKIIKV